MHFIGPAPRCELAKHERKMQGMKLATGPLLCDLSPWTSVTPLCAVFFSPLHFRLFALLAIAVNVAEKCRLCPLMFVSAAESRTSMMPFE